MLRLQRAHWGQYCTIPQSKLVQDRKLQDFPWESWSQSCTSLESLEQTCARSQVARFSLGVLEPILHKFGIVRANLCKIASCKIIPGSLGANLAQVCKFVQHWLQDKNFYPG